jgi:hypothetical protein
MGAWYRRLLQRDVARNHDHGHTAFENRRAHCAVQDLRHLCGVGNQFDEVAAFLEQLLRMRFLEVIQADFRRRNMRCNGQHRHLIAVRIEQAVDQMEVTRPTTARADREFAGGCGIRASRERRDFFVAHMQPLNAIHAALCVAQTIETVAGHSPDALDAGQFQGLRQLFRYGNRCHDALLLSSGVGTVSGDVASSTIYRK